MELVLVLLVAFGLHVASSLYTFFHPAVPTMTNAGLTAGVWQELIALTVFGAFFFSRGRRLSGLGLGFRWTDLPKGLGLVIACFAVEAYSPFVIRSCWYLLTHKNMQMPPNWNFAAVSRWTLLPFLCLNPFFEEILVRGYLVTELTNLRFSVAAATLVSLALQTSYHLYYGIVGALSVGAGLSILAIYYAKSRNLTPVIVAHLLWDLTALLQA
jgi:membrane protease YdiL (CAAX protease family)